MSDAMDMMKDAVGGVKVGRFDTSPNMGLYESLEIEEEIASLAEKHDGEIPEEEYERLIQAQTSSTDKIEGLCKHFRNLQSTIAACSAEKRRLERKAKNAENRLESAKKFITPYVRAKKKITAGTFTLTTIKSEVVVLDKDFNDEFYMKEKITKTPDKKAIKADLKAGESIIGAEIQERISLQIK